MSVNTLYTFQELLNQGIEGKKFEQILIPRIQRAYAQGRVEEKQVRESILKEMFEGMAMKREVEFSFIYGSLNGNHFELLDGQQRITTLFLLHLYVYIKEQGRIPEWLQGRFSYETRKTSHDFILKLTELSSIDSASERPSSYIHKKIWYTQSYRVDSTVQAMLTMLDAIHEAYNKYEGIQFSDRLKYLKFYVLPLDKFGLTEELYIKMNARGLPLTPFENFKADIVDCYKPNQKSASDDQLAEWLDFATKFDTSWIDIFWDKESESDKEFNDKFFRFFYRYCAILCFTQLKKGTSADRFKEDADFLFFNELSEHQSEKGVRYAGFEKYKLLIDSGIDLKSHTSKILDFFRDHKDIVEDFSVSPWGDKYYFFNDSISYTLKTAVVFATLTHFITTYDTISIENLKRWKRVVWNVVENTYLLDVPNVHDVAGELNTIRNLLNILEKDSSTGNIYETLRSSFLEKSLPVTIREEAKKAAFIASNPAFEQLFIDFERHEYFRGFIDVVLTEGVDYQSVARRVERISPLFNAEGVNHDALPDHIFYRAIFASIKNVESILRMHIKEWADEELHLKEILRREDVRGLIISVLDSENDVCTELQAAIENRHNSQLQHSELIDDETLKRGIDRLCTDLRLWEWIAQHSSADPVVCKIHDRVLKIRVPRSWYDKIYVTCDRQEYIPEIIDLGYNYEVPKQEETYNKYGYYYDVVVTLKKSIDGTTIKVDFDHTDRVTFTVTCKSPKQKASLCEKLQLSNDNPSNMGLVYSCNVAESVSMAANLADYIKD